MYFFYFVNKRLKYTYILFIPIMIFSFLINIFM